jgi:hypothetical protein
MKLLSRLLPHQRLNDNPLFNLEMRRIHWGSTERALWRYSARRLEIIVGVLLILWLGVTRQDPYYSVLDNFALLLLGVSLLAEPLLDYLSMIAALGSINAEVAAGRWDLLCMTSLTISKIVAAKHGAAQVRAWRYMILLMALRLAVLLMIAIGLLAGYGRDYNWIIPAYDRLLWTVFSLVTILALGALYIVEPVWRVRMVTAIGLALSARARSGTSAVLLAGSALGTLWLVSLCLGVGVVIGSSVALSQLAMVGPLFVQALFCTPMVLAALYAMIYGFYSIIQIGCLRRAERWIAASRAN